MPYFTTGVIIPHHVFSGERMPHLDDLIDETFLVVLIYLLDRMRPYTGVGKKTDGFRVVHLDVVPNYQEGFAPNAFVDTLGRWHNEPNVLPQEVADWRRAEKVALIQAVRDGCEDPYKIVREWQETHLHPITDWHREWHAAMSEGYLVALFDCHI